MPTTLDCSDINFDALVLSRGSHGDTFSGACCVMEKANLLATCRTDLAAKYGKPSRFEDNHPSVSPSLRRAFIRLNDRWLDNDGTPTRFAPKDTQAILSGYAERLLGTNTGPADETTRALMAANWITHEALPLWLDAATMTAEAAQLRALPEFATMQEFYGTYELRESVRLKARVVRDQAWKRYHEARSGSAAVAAAVAEAVAEAVAAAAVVAAAAAVEAVAVAAAAERVRPIVEKLQRSALQLFDSMILVGANA